MRLEEYPAAELGPALAAAVAEDLIAALAARGRAGLAVPGGTTPVFFLRALGRVELDWARVAIAPTDERCVAPTHPRANQRLLGETLFAGHAAAATFVPLHGGQGLEAVATALTQNVLPLDVAVLGMGEDMHTASLFPKAVGLKAALGGEAPAVAITAPGQEERRVSLSAPVLAAAPKRYLLIKGTAKRAALERAMTLPIERAPVRAVLDGPGEVAVFYAE